MSYASLKLPTNIWYMSYASLKLPTYMSFCPFNSNLTETVYVVNSISFIVASRVNSFSVSCNRPIDPFGFNLSLPILNNFYFWQVFLISSNVLNFRIKPIFCSVLYFRQKYKETNVQNLNALVRKFDCLWKGKKKLNRFCRRGMEYKNLHQRKISFISFWWNFVHASGVFGIIYFHVNVSMRWKVGFVHVYLFNFL